LICLLATALQQHELQVICGWLIDFYAGEDSRAAAAEASGFLRY
jgi:hypothetical protein